MSDTTLAAASPPKKPDPIYVSSRREALAVAATTTLAFLYTVIVCGWMGYGRDPKTLTFVLGFPDWIFWGIVVPWSVCVVVSLYLGATFMKDEDLGEDDTTGIDDDQEGGAA